MLGSLFLLVASCFSQPIAVQTYCAQNNSLIAACRVGCQLTLETCNISNPLHKWRYSPGKDASLTLIAGESNATEGLCVNVKAYRTKADSLIWITLCHPEHPLRANEGWSFFNGSLVNTRSKLCATASTTGRVELGTCKNPQQQWRYDNQTNLITVG